MVKTNLHNDFEAVKISDISNYSLAIEKFGSFEKEKLTYYNENGGLHFSISDTHKKTIIEYIAAKEKKVIKRLRKDYDLMGVLLTQNWRAAIGLGTDSAYQNGFTLHKVYGVPYLPASAIKGIIRSYTISTYFKRNEAEAQKDVGFQYLFGNERLVNETKEIIVSECAGKINFTNAYAINTEFIIEADIITAHNVQYHSNGNYPSASESPTVIPFLSFKKATFEPFCYIAKGENTKITEGVFAEERPLELIKKIMVQAFEIQGIGAKTNLGYGRLVGEDNPDFGYKIKDIKAQRTLEIKKTEKVLQETQRKKAEEAKRKQKEKEDLNKAKREGVATFIKHIVVYGHLVDEIKKYRIILQIEENCPLPENDHPSIIAQLNVIYKELKGVKKKKFIKQSRINTVSAWIGNEKTTRWFNSKNNDK